ncbi:phage major capsid protein [Granulicella cerasi]|uniref:Phage major capsid protein n=1 Tax=Granulicella cerasi TaxID=741063 RepID=A0ABW1Z3Y5_9BACT|nr:phage major capsid protein [Granulicella cerasi]
MNLADLQEKRMKLMLDASKIATEGTPETRSAFDKMMADVDAIDADIARLERVASFEAEQRTRTVRPAIDGSEERSNQIKQSFRNYLMNGAIEARDLTVAGQGIMIPQLFDPAVISAQKSYGEVYDVVNILKTDHGNPIKMVLDNDTTAGLVGQTVGTDAAEVDPTTSSVTLQVDTFSTGIIKVDNGLITDAGFDIEAWIRDKFAKRFFRGASSLIINGNSGNVASLTYGYSSNAFTSNATGVLKYVDFATAIGTLDPAYQANAVWGMSNATLAAVIALSDSNGRPLFLPDYGNAANGYVGTILGRPVKLITQLPGVATGNTPILFGDFKEAYTFRQQNPGLSILRLNERYAAGYETGFVGFARVGGVVTDAGTHPLVGITIK